MKKILAFIVVLFLALSVFSCASLDIKAVSDYQYTYEGVYDPVVFMEWKILDSEQYIDGNFNYVQLILDNPDKDSSINTIIAVFIITGDQDSTLVAYGYSEYGTDYVYVLDVGVNHYKLWMERPSTNNIHKI